MRRLLRFIEPLLAVVPATQRRRLLQGAGANVLSQVVTAALTLISLPLLLHAWGAPTYGLWIVLSAMPAYLAMSDLGFGWAAAGRMTAAVAAGDYATARRAHQTLLGLTATIVCILGGLILVATAVVDADILPGSGLVDASRVRTAITLLMLNALISLSWSSLTSAWRANGSYPASVMYGDAARILDASLVLIMALHGGDILIAAWASFAARGIGFVILLLITPRLVPWVRYEVTEFSVSEVRLLWRPAIGALLLPLGFSLNVQGMTLVVASTLGMASVATFTAIRTLTRLVIQVMGILGNAIVPEIGQAIGASNDRALRAIVYSAMVTTLAIGAAFMLGTALFGRVAISAYTHGALQPSLVLIILLAVAAVLQGMWNTGSNILLGANRQASVSYLVVAVSAISLLVAQALADSAGLVGVAIVMCFTEGVLIVLVSAVVCRFVGRFHQ